jgi:hypothetical protein
MSPVGVRRRAVGAALFVLALCGADAPADTPIETGERMYRHGVLPSGEPLRATVGQDVILSGARAACANCHRRSGYGGVEGTRVVPPITAQYLFGDQPLPNQGTRSFYDAATFKRALREGLHFSGRPLSAPMPRYALADADLDLLIGYLKTLSAPPPGVSDSEIHFATIVTEAVPARQRQALLDVLDAFVRRQNAERRAPKSPDPRSSLGHGRVYRATHQWRLHVWELKGPAHSWPRQMDSYYRAQPVYAMLGGVGRGDWREIHAHCERLELPCLFPNVDQAEPSEGDYFSMYFTRGVLQEAEVLAQTLLQQASATTRRIVQVYRAHDSGAQAAHALRRALAGASHFEISDQLLTEVDQAGFWEALPTHEPDAIVLWLRDADLVRLSDKLGQGTPLIISDSLRDDPAVALPAALRPRTDALVLRELPAAWQDRRQRIETWLRTQGLALSDERIQANTYLMLTLISRALTHMRENFSREYLMERLEHQAQTGSWVSIYPNLSLGPGQRVASRGGYRAALQADGSLPASAEWIVPGAPWPE